MRTVLQNLIVGIWVGWVGQNSVRLKKIEGPSSIVINTTSRADCVSRFCGGNDKQFCSIKL